ncbi:alpha/beta hydrolase [Corynebacterium renale]|uniref:Alpha-beta hydrolase superfamily lysophospholipase n=1 Tax=Corynebacterium renale TaxID=1724 RepID=A0A2A9DRB0_9CORY|nr:alpha/beta hydrolase [Corynebacterium renale]PFG28512.1 alpha-beta hydrolase superfamily lysophospholipase [Corynebacterium renale]SQI26269.1 putative lysophospholipase [Corynebacterium renale]
MNHSAQFHDTSWTEDVLGPDFQSLTLDLGPDYDEPGNAVATLVRYHPAYGVSGWGSRPALLWVHGLSDYFFHRHVAEYFHRHGFAFYAVDLRKAGRSERPGTSPHYVSNLRHYFPDLDAATSVIAQQHTAVIPMAHSTGGLTVSLWAANRTGAHTRAAQYMPGVILNSPWLDLQFPTPVATAVRMASRSVGKIAPRLPIPDDSLGAYGQSLYQGAHGHWDFNTEWKPLGGVKKYAGWMRAIVNGQEAVHDGLTLPMPVLTLCSTRSFSPKEYSSACDVADVVLDVNDITHWAAKLGSPSTVTPIEGARHDVFLSQPHALNNALKTTLTWLESLNI